MYVENRIRLTEIEDRHIDRFVAVSDDPELLEMMGWVPFGPDEKGRFLQQAKALSVRGLAGGRSVIFSVIEIASDTAIGYVVLKGIDELASRCELGIAIMEADARGRGYGKEILSLALKYAFYGLGLDKVCLTVFPSNERAVRAYQRLGFRQVELLEDSWEYPDGRLADMIVMEVSSEKLPAEKESK